jgi:hypothetical protein
MLVHVVDPVLTSCPCPCATGSSDAWQPVSAVATFLLCQVTSPGRDLLLIIAAVTPS